MAELILSYLWAGAGSDLNSDIDTLRSRIIVTPYFTF